eukprot:TRINITY_DN1338_c0_g1_i2.p1 TRINITY_DN1338_c0_g1~~TRINITY_DN1338_c0_g1_i2.p1  ORF type:complete len:148 (-),score=20.80 TRINITY_DN1338_c0_g1_i2:173-616(-)
MGTEEEVQAMPEVQSACINALKSQGITFKSIEHKAVMTSDEHAKVAGHLSGVLVKNLFMKKKKKRFLIVFEHSKKVDFKELGKAVGANGLRQASDLKDILKVEGGCVTPLAIMNDEQKVTQVFLDASLKNASVLNVHPCVNTATISN